MEDRPQSRRGWRTPSSSPSPPPTSTPSSRSSSPSSSSSRPSPFVRAASVPPDSSPPSRGPVAPTPLRYSTQALDLALPGGKWWTPSLGSTSMLCHTPPSSPPGSLSPPPSPLALPSATEMMRCPSTRMPPSPRPSSMGLTPSPPPVPSASLHPIPEEDADQVSTQVPLCKTPPPSSRSQRAIPSTSRKVSSPPDLIETKSCRDATLACIARMHREHEFFTILSTHYYSQGNLSVIAALLPISNTAYEAAKPFLYANVTISSTNTASILRAIIPALSASSTAAINRVTTSKNLIQRITISSLSFSPAAATLSNNRRPLTPATILSIHTDAWPCLGSSTVMANFIARLCSPRTLCVSIPPDPISSRHATMTLTLILLKRWTRLTTVTLHNAYNLTPSRTRTSLFLPGIRYRLVFGPYPTSTPNAWDEMTTLLRDLLSTGAISTTQGVQVILPFTGSTSIQPIQPTQPRPPVTRSPLAETNSNTPTHPPRTPRISTPPPAVSSTKVTRGTKSAPARLIHEPPNLPRIARDRILRSKRTNLDFVTVEEIAHAYPWCAACHVSW